MRLITDILETLYPTCCPGCGRVVDPNVQWCEECLRKIWNPRLLNSSFTDHLSGYRSSMAGGAAGSASSRRSFPAFPGGSGWGSADW